MSTLRVDNILPYTSGSTINIVGFSGGGNTPPTPTANDFIDVQSYNRWIYGLDAWSEGSKWTTIGAEGDQTDYLKFVLIGGQVNGQPIHRTYVSTSVDYTNLTYRDDGFGSFPVNYVDFINDIFASHSLYTRITGSTNNIYYQYGEPYISGSIGFTGSYCAIDNFDLIFLETGQLDGSTITSTFYGISTKNGQGLGDTFNSISSVSILNYKDNLEQIINKIGTDIRIWYQPQTPGI